MNELNSIQNGNSSLKVCPFCGGEAEFKAMISNGGHPEQDIGYVRCKNCFAGFDITTIREYAIESWNRRTQPENKPLSLEQLRQMNGEPVWHVGKNNTGSYADLCFLDGELIALYFFGIEETGTERESEYGKTWLAYAHKLDES